MNCLLVDNSNTRTKLVWCREGAEPVFQVILTSEITLPYLKCVLKDWQFECVYICSVVPWAAQVISEACQGAEICMLRPEVLPGIDFSEYPDLASLGVDRAVNVVAALQECDAPLVAVDMGTATTFDVVIQGEKQPRFLGGVIAPGVRAMSSALHRCTALLPDVDDWQSAPVIGKNTREAMGAAVRIGYPAMVDAVLDSIQAEVNGKLNVILTGGDAATVAKSMRWPCRLSPLLTLRGIAFAAGVRI